MTLEVEVISTETIKPSSPTPDHLRTLNFSSTDQYVPLKVISIVLFYSSNDDKVENEKRLDRLKCSLSETLTLFYPLGGRFTNNIAIDCNDEGVNFFQARVNGQLSTDLLHPKPELLPRDNFSESGPKVLLSIQANIFDCGGIAVGVTMSHKVGDIFSLSLFIDTWSSVATRREGDAILPPKFGEMSSLNPPKPNISPSPTPTLMQNGITKMFVFQASNVAALIAKGSNNLYVEDPTRLEAVSAFIWRCGLKVVRAREEPVIKSFSVTEHVVNRRGNMVPPLTKYTFGNVLTTVPAGTTIGSESELYSLVAEFRKALNKADNDVNYNSQKELNELLRDKGEVERYTFTSCFTLPYYRSDFGWGEPTLACPIQLNDKNFIFLVDTKCGQGVEAWVALDEEDMAKFETDPELIAFTSG